MSQLRLTPEERPLAGEQLIPIDDPQEPMTEAALRELELDRAADEGMIEPPAPEMDAPGIEPPRPDTDVPRPEVPGPEDRPRPGVEVPGQEVPGPDEEPTDPGIETPVRSHQPAMVSAASGSATFDRS